MLKTESYADSLRRLPDTGRHVVAHQRGDALVVYQGYNDSIADWAVQHGRLGGPAFSFARMSWIKPNFLWMMARSGWASKADQERVLALWISHSDWEDLLRRAVLSSFDSQQHASREEWQRLVKESDVRVQWDPEHHAWGGKLSRRAIQVGLRGEALREFGQDMLRQVEDITPLVVAQRALLDQRDPARLQVPVETVWRPQDLELSERLGIDPL